MAVGISYRTSAVNGAAQSSYTFTSQDIGTASSDRIVVVAIAFYVNSGSTSITSVTIGGVSASAIYDPGSVSATSADTSFWSLAIPSGATADVVVGFSAAPVRCGIGIWAVTGAASTLATSANAIGTSNPLSTAVNIPANCGVIAAVSMVNNINAGTYSWTGLTENYDSVISGSVTQSGASGIFASANPSLTVSSTYSQTSTNSGMLRVIAFQSASISKVVSIASSTAVSIAASRLYRAAVSMTCASATALSRGVGKKVAVACSGAIAVKKAATKTLAISGTTATGIAKRVNKVVQVSCATAVGAIKRTFKSVAVACAASVDLIKSVGKVVSVVSTTASAAMRDLAKSVDVALSTTVSVLTALSLRVVIAKIRVFITSHFAKATLKAGD